MQIFKIALAETDDRLKRIKADTNDMGRAVKDKFNAILAEDFYSFAVVSRRLQDELQEHTATQLAALGDSPPPEIEEGDKKGLRDLDLEIGKLRKKIASFQKFMTA